ncbi:MaoC/PaaZ C-terminal domain-containing protein [Sulfuritalea sp.]|uniref:MaoC/PaaZ C-terminal domain-containing protein n=1 Tax=Sulfuritalea sp. TaxID=2480090 RepID=UPI00286DE571|nr:MaoC/PaaZ C-terminal domain-containing protein [Sulfuritalea sp.]
MTTASSCQRVLLQADFDRFARLTGDDNPIHCDPAFAAKSHFGATVAHGMLLYSCICKALTEQVGPGVVQMEQTLMFPNPTYVGDRLRIDLQVDVERGGLLDILTEVTKVGAGDAALATATGRCRVVAPGATLPTMAPAPHPVELGDAELHGLRPGISASSTRSFSAADLDEYGDLSGDRNPIFRDDVEAQMRGFKSRIVPWPLLAGMFSDLLGTRLPGRGTGWMKQQLRYPSAAYPGEALTATVCITRLRADKELVNLATRVSAADGRVVCDGEALVLVKNLENKLENKLESRSGQGFA